MVDLAFGEAVAAPGEPRGRDDLVALAGEEDPAVLVLGLDEAPALVVGDVAVATHLVDVDVVAEAVHRFEVVLGLGLAEGERHVVTFGGQSAFQATSNSGMGSAKPLSSKGPRAR